MKLNKKASAEESSLNFLIGIIIAVLLMSAIGIVAYKYYEKQGKISDSHEELVTSLSSLQDQEQSYQIFYISEGYVLMAFQPGDDDFGDRAWNCPDSGPLDKWTFAWQINRPDSCGSAPCVCLCKKGIFDEVLTKKSCEKSTMCSPITNLQTNITFVDPDCDHGVFMPGPETGIFTVYYKKDGDTVYISAEQDFVAEEKQELIDLYKLQETNLEQCKSSNDCMCEIDFEFLKENLMLEFSETVSLFDRDDETSLYSNSALEFESDYNSFYLYYDKYLYLGPSMQDEPITVSNKLYLQDNTFHFIEESKLSEYQEKPACTSTTLTF